MVAEELSKREPSMRARVIVQWLRVLASLSEDLSSATAAMLDDSQLLEMIAPNDWTTFFAVRPSQTHVHVHNISKIK